MLDSRWLYYCSLIFIISLTCSVFTHGNVIDRKILHVGDELLKETLPLQMGSRLYKLEGLKSNTWYEVKISYPASIPSRFSLQLKKDSSDLGLRTGRKLLNTEKLIFKTDGIDSLSEQVSLCIIGLSMINPFSHEILKSGVCCLVQQGLQVLVTVEPEGVVAIPGTQERKYVIFNIVCNELLLGIPHKAWYVVFLVLLCLGLAVVVPKFLPPFLLPKNGSPSLTDRITNKDS